MARPRHSLTAMADKSPSKARAIVFEALQASLYDYALASAMLGVSRRQLYVLCQAFGITGAVTCLRRQAGRDHRGRPRKDVPPRVVLERVLAASKGSVAAAARALGVSPPTLKAWLAAA